MRNLRRTDIFYQTADFQVNWKTGKILNSPVSITISWFYSADGWRHKWSPDMKSAFCIDIDSPSFSSIDLIFQTSVRPDLIIFINSSVNVLELTVCHELNLLKSKLNKQNKYKNLKMFLQPKFRNHIKNVFTLEVSTLGFISDISKFCSISKIPSLPCSVKKEIIISVLNLIWWLPSLLSHAWDIIHSLVLVSTLIFLNKNWVSLMNNT